MGIDILPTLCAMAGRALPAGVELDGRDLTAVLTRGAPSPHEALILFDNEVPVGVRTQRWKYVSGAYYRGMRFPLDKLGYTEVFDMAVDSAESYTVAAAHPEVAADLKARLARARTDFAPYRHADIPPVFKQLRGVIEHLQD
jgi:arylsulfatase A-like enzyme